VAVQVDAVLGEPVAEVQLPDDHARASVCAEEAGGGGEAQEAPRECVVGGGLNIFHYGEIS